MPEQETIDLSTVEKARAAWVKALRSGEYTQGMGDLTHLEYAGAETQPRAVHCCLGVAGDLCVKAGLPNVRWDVNGRLCTRLKRDGAQLPAYLAKKVFNLTPGDQAILAGSNDNSGATFADIADAIEKAGTGHITAVKVHRTP